MIADEYQIDLLREVCENFIVQFLNSELTKLNHMSDLQKNAVLKKGLSLLSLTKTYSSNKIAFSAYQLISAFSTETIVQHPAFKVLSDAYKNKVLLYRLARADKYGSITAYKLSEVPSFIAQTDEHCSAN